MRCLCIVVGSISHICKISYCGFVQKFISRVQKIYILHKFSYFLQIGILFTPFRFLGMLLVGFNTL